MSNPGQIILVGGTVSPATPAAGRLSFYVKADGKLYSKNDQGLELELGKPGVGVNTGGTAGQVLAKVSGTDYDTHWVTPVTDWSSLTGKPTTLAGFGITDAFTQTNVYSLLSLKADSTYVASNLALKADALDANLSGTITLASNTKVIGNLGNVLAGALTFQSNTGNTSKLRMLPPSDNLSTGINFYQKTDAMNSRVLSVGYNGVRTNPFISWGENIAGVSDANVGSKLFFGPVTGSDNTIRSFSNVVAAEDLATWKTNADAKSLVVKGFVDEQITATAAAVPGQARTAISVSGDLAYDSATGIISYVHPATRAWGTITSTPTTLTGYGITDAATKVNPALSGTISLGNSTKIAGDYSSPTTSPYFQGTGGTVTRVRVLAPTGGGDSGVTLYGNNAMQNAPVFAGMVAKGASSPSIFWGSTDAAGVGVNAPVGSKFYFGAAQGSSSYANITAVTTLADWKTYSDVSTLVRKDALTDLETRVPQLARDQIFVTGDLFWNAATGTMSFTQDKSWTAITGKPTTIAGYGITDATSTARAAVSVSGDLAYNSATGVISFTQDKTFASLTGKPTTLAGYGITDSVPATNPTFGGTITWSNNTKVAGDFSSAANTPIIQGNTGTGTRIRIVAPATTGTSASIALYANSDFANTGQAGFSYNSTTTIPSIFWGSTSGGTSINPTVGSKFLFTGNLAGSTAYANVLAVNNATDFATYSDSASLVRKDYLTGNFATTASLAAVATSGAYADLSGKPTIPTDNAVLSNGAGYQNASQVTAAIVAYTTVDGGSF